MTRQPGNDLRGLVERLRELSAKVPLGATMTLPDGDPLAEYLEALIEAAPSLIGAAEAISTRNDELVRARAALGEARKHFRHQGLCAVIGGYGYCSCGLEAADALVSAAIAPAPQPE